ncbi:MAG: GTP pyrophosphokinase [Blastocatellia bacterium]
MATLERAIAIAVQAHQGQRDKAGAPYILHPLRLMMRMQTEAEMIAAVLHDVIEDTEWTPDGLRAEGFSAGIIEAIECLTRPPDETYDDFIERVKTSPVAWRVKIADLEDNMNIRRIEMLTPKDLERLEKYHRAWRALNS